MKVILIDYHLKSYDWQMSRENRKDQKEHPTLGPHNLRSFLTAKLPGWHNLCSPVILYKIPKEFHLQSKPGAEQSFLQRLEIPTDIWNKKFQQISFDNIWYNYLLTTSDVIIFWHYLTYLSLAIFNIIIYWKYSVTIIREEGRDKRNCSRSMWPP